MQPKTSEEIASEPYIARGDDAERDQNCEIKTCSKCPKKGCKINAAIRAIIDLGNDDESRKI